MKYRCLNRKTISLDREQLKSYLESLALDHILQNNSSVDTYPIPRLKENFKDIEEVYHLLNEHVKLGIPIHPAGEWLLDNFYIIDETVKTILQDLPLKKYTEFLGLNNRQEKGFARIYVLAYELVNCTDNRIDINNIKEMLSSYQKNKILSMEEIWNLGIFMQIALIQNIRDICEKIYLSQMQKYRVENILESFFESKDELKYKNISEYKSRVKGYGEMKYPFIEYMSYKLKKQGRKATPFIMVLEEQVNKMGTTIDEVIKKEHFDIALKKVGMANCITSMKELLRMDFLSIFEETNGVEEILKNDPAEVYSKMDYKTKEQYRNAIKQIAGRTKIAEVYIARKALELAKIEVKKRENLKENNTDICKEEHIGYYLISNGIEKLYESLKIKRKINIKKETNVKIYIFAIWSLSFFLTIIFMTNFYKQIHNLFITILLGILLILPIQEIIVKIIQYILGKIVKPKVIPKMDFYDGVPNEYSTFVVIPTILKSKEKVAELMKKLEIYYLANKSENIYFALLGDCSSGPNKEEPYDKEVIEEGLKQVKYLNQKYKNKLQLDNNKGEVIPKFNFIYRKRHWNSSEECYLGWERKRGLLNQFNEFLLGEEQKDFIVNTIDKDFINKIKYVITLDADTELVLNSALELIASMAHILNTPKLNEKKDCVIEGYGIMQPRVGITLDAANKNLFTKIFAGSGGVDLYANAISDVYQDNFNEGIFTGKGIYDLKVFSNILYNEIPENTVLSHDLLEGSYLRCGLCSDVVLMDGYPSNYLSFKNRLHRWIRGDFQILKWTGKEIINRKEKKKNNPLNLLSKYKIIDNLIRAITPIFTLLGFILIYILDMFYNIKIETIVVLLTISILSSTILDIINRIIYRKTGQSRSKTFSNKISSLSASIIRGTLDLLTIPDKVYYSLNAIIKTLYRLFTSKKHLLEWTTSEDAERLSKKDLKSYFFNMIPNIVLGIIGIFYVLLSEKNITNLFLLILSILWLCAPAFYWYIGKESSRKEIKNEINIKDQEYLLDLGKKTWQFFKDSLNRENHYLPPDNYQEGRKPILVDRTSSTNIGLALLCVITAYDLKYESLEDTLKLLNEMVITIDSLPKWYGHLYNWYNIKTLEPLIPRYISTVDSGNFVGYVYVLKTFYEDIKRKLENKELKYDEQKTEELLNLIPAWANKPIDEISMANADFTKLYDKDKGLFSIGFNIEENKLTPSYYDLLASEARQASFVAISKKDVPIKHWSNLSRTLTVMNGYNGLISWSGTAFEYLMPNIIMKNEEGSLIDESCEFMLMSQKEYAKKLNIPWGFSETAYYLKDLNNNYQYKAIGIPWLGLKRGLEEDMVVASYASVMALTRHPKSVIQNIKELDKLGMNQKYGLYESIDYTPIRMSKEKNKAIVRTYMAHHQALILLSINNFFNNNILQKRFSLNPEVAGTEILLQETMPEKRIITKEEKLKPVKIMYEDYENYAQRIYTKSNTKFNNINILSSDDYSIVMDQKGRGYSKYKQYMVNRFSTMSDETQGIFFYFKNVKNRRIWTSGSMPYLTEGDKYEVVFTEDSNKITRLDGPIETIERITISPEKRVEIRNVRLKNQGIEEEVIELISTIEPLLSILEEDISHHAFQNLFLTIEYDKEKNIFIVKRKNRSDNTKGIYLAVSLYTQDNTIGDLEYEIDKEKFQGRGNLLLPKMIENSKPFSNKIQSVVNPILALKRTISLKPENEVSVSLILSISEDRQEAIQNVIEYQNEEKIKQAFELAIAKADTESRYLRLNAKQIETYQKMLRYLLFTNPFKNIQLDEFNDKKYSQSDLWKFGISGDLPILLVKISQISDSDFLDEILKAYEFFRLKNVAIDLVILNEEPNSYEKYTKEAIYNSILNANLGYMQNISGGIFVLENDENSTLEFYSKLILDAKKGPISRQLKDLEYEYLDNEKEIGNKTIESPKIYEEEKIMPPILSKENLQYENEYGGFRNNGKEYLIEINKENRLPTVWSNIMANNKFGTLVTESMGGFTWSKNSRLNRISNWNNDQVLDIPSEIIYMQDEDSLKNWSIGLNPLPDKEDYKIIYGFGYSTFTHISEKIEQEATVFVPEKESAKVTIIKLKNQDSKKKKLRLIYYLKPVLGENEERTKEKLESEFQLNNNLLILQNKTNMDFEDIVYITSSEKIKSYTCSKDFFIGSGNLSNPAALKKVSLDNENASGKKAIMAIEIQVELDAYENKKITFVLGSEDNILDCQDKAYQFSKIGNAEEELEHVKNSWKEVVDRVQVETPMKSFDILMNGWLVYQTIVSRLYARSAFYQSGGAYGFRDQLQDTIGLKYFDTNIMKEQIIKHSKHQFIEGDVEHWWHEETKRGIRTRFSDDLLWLVYIVEEYIKTVGDYSILNIETNYLDGEKLEEDIDEKYDEHFESDIKESIFRHCERAIKKSLVFGENGLPKIGSGDWNDGFSKVGNKGKGESVWLGFFLYKILKEWIEIKEKSISEEDILTTEECKETMERIKKALNTNGWDGRWYKRAFMDNGSELGTIQNEECKIDGIAQSWAVISGAGDNDKKYISMESLENHLVDKENGIIKLLDPPFEKGALDPGYIKSYLPGTRENGGQYTHVCCSCGQFLENILEIKPKHKNVHNNNTPIKY